MLLLSFCAERVDETRGCTRDRPFLGLSPLTYVKVSFTNRKRYFDYSRTDASHTHFRTHIFVVLIDTVLEPLVGVPVPN